MGRLIVQHHGGRFSISNGAAHMSKWEVACGRCGEVCQVEGDYPKYVVWCDACNDYIPGFDAAAFAREVAADIADGRPSS